MLATPPIYDIKKYKCFFAQYSTSTYSKQNKNQKHSMYLCHQLKLLKQFSVQQIQYVRKCEWCKYFPRIRRRIHSRKDFCQIYTFETCRITMQASLVQWQNARLPRGRPGFDSRTMHELFFRHYMNLNQTNCDKADIAYSGVKFEIRRSVEMLFYPLALAFIT